VRPQGAFVVGSVSPVARDRCPHGAALARKIRADIDPVGWSAGELEAWYGAGWSVSFRRGSGEVELVVAPADEAGMEWAVQVAPARLPGPIGRALGRHASATPEDVLELARAAHAVLAADGRFTGLRWRWNRFPEGEAESTREPMRPVRRPWWWRLRRLRAIF
jgi:hypothetical protein